MSVKIVHAKLTDVDDGQWFGFKVAAGIVNALRRGRLELESSTQNYFDSIPPLLQLRLDYKNLNTSFTENDSTVEP
ncbi:hypothetical protein GBA52_007831 [Prunus armeniaca]|nr:hypothetical protein GBA52_007831 [Prunus armeniaca]